MKYVMRFAASLVLIGAGLSAIVHDKGIDHPGTVGYLGLALCAFGCIGLAELALGED